MCGGPGRALHAADPARGLRRHARCDACGLVFVDPPPADTRAENEALYGEPVMWTSAEAPDGPPQSAPQSAPRSAAQPAALPPARPTGRAEERLLREVLARVGPGARVLDVGCGAGAFLARARALGLTALGVELSPTRAAQAAAQAGVPVHTGGLEGLPAAPPWGAGFDLIRLHQVLEHAPSPRALLDAARARLAPGGELVLSTPNAASLAHRALGARWRQLGHATNGHLVLLAPRSLRRLATACGLRVRRCRTRGARAWSIVRRGPARRLWRLVELALEPWVRLAGLGSTLEARLTAGVSQATGRERPSGPEAT